MTAVRETAAALMEQWLSLDLIIEGGRCGGVVALDPEGGRVEVRARHTLIATGGAGQLFAVTTNPPEATGDGIAMALRAGVPVADVEFMQFHPTALAPPAMPRPLLSEALRGHGALLRDANGEQFIDELSPRDVVARAMTARMQEQGVGHLWLDARNLERFAERFPTIHASLALIGLDARTDLLPIAPAAHYLSGGIVVDLDGASALPGLWACGETTCSGVHGANRLASNSLLDGMVFAARMVEALEAGRDGPEPTGAMRAVLGGDGDYIGGHRLARPATTGPGADGAPAAEPEPLRQRLQQAMTRGAGVLRSSQSLSTTVRELQLIEAALPAPVSPGAVELGNLLSVGTALVAAASAREESRGAHTRTDFPTLSDSFLCRLVIT